MSKLQAKSEALLDASPLQIWAIITDITKLHRINPGVVKATGIMNQSNATRTCEINNRGKMGTMTERLIEMEPEKRTVWSLESDTMGMSKMLKDTRFCFILEQEKEGKTLVRSETYYRPAHFFAALMNGLVIRKMIRKVQDQILENIKAELKR